MDVWSIVFSIYFFNGTVGTQRVRTPTFSTVELCEGYLAQPHVRSQILKKYFSKGTGIAYVLPKCELEIEV